MKLKDIKTGMKVKLLGKHAFGDNYDNIEDFYDERNEFEDVIKIKEQGYGIVVGVEEGNMVVVNNEFVSFDEHEGWFFLPSDIEPYEEDRKESEDLIQEKSLREWIVTPKVIFTVGTEEYFVGNNGCAYSLDSGDILYVKNKNYDEKLNHITGLAENKINKIEYQGKVLWERKEYFTLNEAIQLNKQIKHKDWECFHDVSGALKELSDIVDESTNNDFIIEALSEKVWEVR